MSEVFKGQLTHRPSGQDAGVHLTVNSRQIVDGYCRIVWEAVLTLPGTTRHIELHTTIAQPQYAHLEIKDLAQWLLVGELGE